MNYHYSQKDPRWAKMKLGHSGLTMRDFGCVVTSCAMMLSYFYDREVLPSELLKWLNQNHGFTGDGLLYWQKIEQFTGGKLRYNRKFQNATTYTVRQCVFGRFNHWLIDSPVSVGKVIDPLPGQERGYKSYQWTGRNRAFYGIPVKTEGYFVDIQYGHKRTWKSFLRERFFAFNPWIRRQIGRAPTHREIKALAYGYWDFGAVFRNTCGDAWLALTKPEYLQSF